MFQSLFEPPPDRQAPSFLRHYEYMVPVGDRDLTLCELEYDFTCFLYGGQMSTNTVLLLNIITTHRFALNLTTQKR